ncbi:hypothetical protein QBC47DRAFT_191903 [Echria macrotheca]|uniref:Cyclin N-terminal domain-containing protein n=1 Tax=Echria macrotheca TaxID=438768 RepID=A0AAJ0BC82_9PEZI|nr:hypothetical protein QBC47DRAFT_191903 [Echria macrotheca]
MKPLSRTEIDEAALDVFVYKPVTPEMISFLAAASANVIQCDPTLMPPTPFESRPPQIKVVPSEDKNLPTLEEFITQLVISSNVQVPTLMSTLVYLNRLRSRLQPMAKGMRCTTHRIFLAALILAAKYLNDSSPKNKHWANYSVISTEAYNFGFTRTEVNLMEKQLLLLLEWDLRIQPEDLYRELDWFLEPIRADVRARHQRRMRRHAEKMMRLEQEAWVSVNSVSVAYVSPPPSRDSSRSRRASPPSDDYRDDTPPSLYSSGSSYAGSTTSRATTPISEVDPSEPAIASYGEVEYESPIDYVAPCVPEKDAIYTGAVRRKTPLNKGRLPYEISVEDARHLEENGGRVKRMRGVIGRYFGTGTNPAPALTVR